MVSRGFADCKKYKPCCQALGALVLLNSVHLPYDVRMILFKSLRWNKPKCLSDCVVEQNDQNVFLSVVYPFAIW